MCVSVGASAAVRQHVDTEMHLSASVLERKMVDFKQFPQRAMLHASDRPILDSKYYTCTTHNTHTRHTHIRHAETPGTQNSSGSCCISNSIITRAPPHRNVCVARAMRIEADTADADADADAEETRGFGAANGRPTGLVVDEPCAESCARVCTTTVFHACRPRRSRGI